jgi:hypothetical protein
VLSWILASLLVIIWLAFFLPSRHRSPAASVEEFEQKMSLLAETHRDAPGRWVLMPRRRFLGPQDRARARVVRRRRLIFTGLLEATVLFLLMGMVPPLRPMLFAAGALAFLLLVYSALLVQLRIGEHERARRGPARRRATAPSRVTYPDGYTAERVYSGGNGHGYASTYGDGQSPRPARRANGRTPIDEHATYVQVSADGQPARVTPAAHANGNGNGHGPGSTTRPFDVASLQVLDDDVHVVIRRPDEVAAESADVAPPAAAVR